MLAAGLLLAVHGARSDAPTVDEFAHLPAGQVGRAHRREGFEAASADRIFESTYTAQTLKRGAGRD